VLNHKPTKVLRLSTSNLVVSRDMKSLHQKLAKDSEIRKKPLQLGICIYIYMYIHIHIHSEPEKNVAVYF